MQHQGAKYEHIICIFVFSLLICLPYPCSLPSDVGFMHLIIYISVLNCNMHQQIWILLIISCTLINQSWTSK